MICIFIIMLCWCIEMPLWLSIVGTVVASLKILVSIGDIFIDYYKKDDIAKVGISFDFDKKEKK